MRAKDLNVPAIVIITLLLLVPAFGGLLAVRDLFLFTFYYDTIDHPWQRSNTPWLITIYSSPFVLAIGLTAAWCRPGFSRRVWLIIVTVCLLPLITLVASFFAVFRML